MYLKHIRNVYKHNKSFAITLPIGWVKANRIKPMDQLIAYQHKDMLVITTSDEALEMIRKKGQQKLNEFIEEIKRDL